MTQSDDKTICQQKSDNTKMPPKSSIIQLLRTDLGRSVGVTTATQLAWLTGLRAKPSHSPQQSCEQNDMKTLLYRQQTNSHTKCRSNQNRYTYSIGITKETIHGRYLNYFIVNMKH